MARVRFRPLGAIQIVWEERSKLLPYDFNLLGGSASFPPTQFGYRGKKPAHRWKEILKAWEEIFNEKIHA